MEHCSLCGQSRSPYGNISASCSGLCGRVTHASCARIKDAVLVDGNKVSFWFCQWCRHRLLPIPDAGPLRRTDESGVPRDWKQAGVDASAGPELPPEVWIEIFMELTAAVLLEVRMVCRRWRGIVDGSSTLMDKLAANFAKLAVDADYEPVHLPAVKKAWFKNATITEIGSWWSSFGQDLTEIGMFYESKIKISALVETLKNTPNLYSLQLIGITVTGKCSTIKELTLAKLELLELEEMKSVKLLKALGGLGASKLKSLSVTWDCFDKDPSLEMVSFVSRFQGTLEELCITCTKEILVEMTKLDDLRLKKFYTKGSGLETNESLMDFLRTQPSLEFLNIYETQALGETNLTELNALGHYLPNLKSLDFLLIEADEVTNLSLLAPIANLEILSISGVDEELNYTICGLPKLHQLELTDSFFEQGLLPQWFAEMPNLRTLTIEHCKIGCWLDLLEALASMKQLQRLTMTAIYDSTVTDRDYSFELPNLKCLHLKHTQLSQRLLAAILGRCSGLRELSLEDMDFSAEVLHIICRKLPHVTRLCFDRCKLLSFRGTKADLVQLVGDGKQEFV